MPSRHHAATPAPRRAPTKRRRPAPRRRISRLLAWLLTAWLGTAGWALAQVAPNALPTGGQVRVGTGTLTQTGNLMLIQQSSDRLGLDWQSFNIGSGATVEFRQPGASSVALNRVLGNDPSKIYGQLKANGQVFLTNPNGVLFSPTARVDVGGLVASALDLSQQDFAEGRFQFNATGVNGSAGSVVNQGQIRASAGGYLAFFGQQVANEGELTVDAGSVVLAAGRSATVSISGNGLLQAVVTAGTVPGQVDNAGRIAADGGVVTLSARSAQDIAASLVNNSGIVRANALVERGGEIWITGDNVASSGALSATGAAGGQGGRINVVADLQRGQAQIGGTLDAGTAGGGQGGFVETSGAKVQVARDTRVNTTGERGSAGTWLIDPTDFNIAASGGDISGATLSGNLGGGNVTILSTQGAGGTAGHVNVNDAVSWSANKLTLNALANININAALTGTGTASLALEYGQGALAAGNTASYNVAAAVTLPAGSNFSTKLGSNGATNTYTVITTLAALQNIDTNATTRAGLYALGADIDLTNQAFAPIGVETSTTANAANSFTGRFDGLNHTLTGLTISGTLVNAGLFASLYNADVRNLTLVGGSVAGSTRVGAIAGTADGATVATNLHSSASVTSTGTTSDSAAGGLFGRFWGTGSLSGSSASGAVTGANVINAATNFVGGLVGNLAATGGLSSGTASGNVFGGNEVGGLVGSSAVTITGSTASGTAQGSNNVGGLVGQVTGGSIVSSSAVGNVSNTDGSGAMGGLVATMAGGGSVTNSQASGNVSGGGTSGGLIGSFSGGGSISGSTAGGNVSSVAASADVGGLVGMASGAGSLSNSSASGNVSAASNADTVGGLVGQFQMTGGLSNSLSGTAASTVSGGNYTGGVIGWTNNTGAFANDAGNGNAVAFRGASVSGTLWVGGVFGYSASTATLTGFSSSASIVSTNNAGGVAGYTGGLLSSSSATGSVQGTATVGGLVGQAVAGVAGSSASGPVTNTTTTGYTGGLVGYVTGGGIAGSTAGGTVTGGNHTGGLVGYFASGGNISGSTATGNVTSTAGAGATAGGLAGYASGAGTLSNSSASGSVTASTTSYYVGGLVGEFHMTGGLVNSSAGSAGSTVSGGYDVGGVIGWTDIAAAFVSDVPNGSVITFRGTSVSGTLVNGTGYVGGLIGISNGTAALTGLSASATVASSASAGATGGLAGYSRGNVTNATASGTVSGRGSVGGLIGEAAGTNVTVTDSSAGGNVTVTAGGNAGGLIGYASGAGVLRGTATGNVSGGANGGGLVGYFNNGGSIRNSSASGAVTGAVTAGGLVGNATGAGLIADSSAVGDVTGTANNSGGHVGGLVGYFAMAGGISGSQADGTPSAGTNVGGLVGYSNTAGAITTSVIHAPSVSGGTWVGGAIGYAQGSGAITGLSTTMNVTATGNAGGLVGYAGGLVSGGSATGTVQGSGYVGGLVGQAAAGVANSTAIGNVTNGSASGSSGGLIGYLNGGSLSASTASGNVSGGVWLGGLVGYYSSTGSIANSSASGNVSTTTNNSSYGSAGGLVGYMAGGGGITGSSAIGTVTTAGTCYSYCGVGGLVGYYSSNGSISGSTATGAVSSTASNADVGGLVGYADGTGALSNSSASGNVSGVAGADTVGGLVGEFRMTGGLANSLSGSNGSTVSGGTNTGGVIGWTNVAAAFTNDANAGTVIAYRGASVSGGTWVGGVIGASTGTAALTGLSASVPVTATGSAGGLAGYTAGNVTNASAAASVTGATYVGGLIGQAAGSGTTLTDVSATGTVTNTSTNYYTGGLVGYATGSGVLRGSASGNVSGGGYAGGLIGVLAPSGNSNGSIRNASALGNVSGAPYAGGLVGSASGTGTIADSTAFGNVTGTGNGGGGQIGGLVGYFGMGGGISGSRADGSPSAGTYVGGLVGYSNTSGAITTSTINSASVSGGTWVGGAVGYAQGSGAITGLSTAMSVTATGNAGGLVGYAGGPVSGGNAVGNVQGSGYVGGLVGQSAVSVSGSTASGAVTNSSATGATGGLVGYVSGGGVSSGSAIGAVSGGAYAGGLVGYFGSSGSITNSTAGGNVSLSVPGSGAYYASAGGLVGYMDGGGGISGSSATGTVTVAIEGSAASATCNYYYCGIGGLVGYFASNGSISGSTAAGNVSSAVGGTDVGGLIGYASGSGSLSSSSASGTVTAVAGADTVGGLVGEFRMSGGVSNSQAGASGSTVSGGSYAGGLFGYANFSTALAYDASTNPTAFRGASVSGGSWVGGLIGYNAGSASISGFNTGVTVTATGNAGGLLGYTGSGVSDARATGTVTGSGSYVGGLIGQFSSNSDVRNARADGNVSGPSNVGGLIGYASGNGGLYDSQAFGRVTGTTTNGGVGGAVGSSSLGAGLTRVEASGLVSGGNYTGGVVGYLGSGNLTNVQAKGASVIGNGYTGGVAGYAGSMVATDISSIASVEGGSYTGGLIGQGSGNGSITRGVASGSVTGSANVGGLVGWLDGYQVTDSSASGKVIGIGSSVFAGGLIGRFGYYYYYNNQAQFVTGSHAIGDVVVDAQSAYVGGLVGYSYYASVTASTASGVVTVTDSSNSGSSSFFTGGLVGYFGGNTGANGHSLTNSSASGAVTGRYYTGGLVGYFSGAKIQNTTASGAVTGTNYVGGLVGHVDGDTVANSSASGAVSGTSRAGGLAGYASTTAAMNEVSATGAVTVTGSSPFAGGLVGELNGAGISGGFASGNVTTAANSGYAGGLVGYAYGSSYVDGGSSTAVNDSRATGNVSGAGTSGGLVGYMATYFYGNGGRGGIANSHASGNVSGTSYAGGLVGYFDAAGSNAAQDIGNSDASGSVSGVNNVGGLVGYFSGGRGINTSFATGAVTGRGTTSTNYLGGLVGQYRFYKGDATSVGLSQSYATGSVSLQQVTLGSGTSVFAGGLVGQLVASDNVSVAARDVYATGPVTLASTNGRLYAGGLVGYLQGGVARGYATGAVSATGGTTPSAGGLVGGRNSTSSVVTDSFWDSTGTGQATSIGGGTALTPAQMQQAASFTNWAIASDGSGANTGAVWRIYEGHTTPLLRSFLTPLTLTLADASKVYDGTTSFGDAQIAGASGPVSHPERILTSALSPDVGSYNIAASGVWSLQNGYDLTVSGSAVLTVTPRPLTLAGVIADKVYDGTRNATVIGAAQPTGLVAGEDLAVDIGNVTAVFDTKNVGTNKTVTVSGYTLSDGVHGKASNYSLGAGTQTTASITAATLTAGGFSAVDRAYDGTTVVAISATGNSTVSGVIGNDDVHVDLSGLGSGTMADKNVGTNKPVTVSGVALSGADAGNYRIGGVDAVTVNITPKTVTVDSLTGVNRVYNATTSVQVSTSGAQITGLVSGDIVSVQQGNLAGTMADKNVGTGKAVTITGGVGLRGPDAANYTAVASPTTVTITPSTTYLYVSRTNATDRPYDGTAAADVNVQIYYGQYSGDQISLTYDAPTYSDRNVAYNGNGAVTTKTITVANAALTGADAGNYVLNTSYYGNTTYGTISPKPLGVTGVVAENRAYDGTRNVNVNVAGAVVDTSGLVAADIGSVVVQLPGSGTVTGTVASKNVGNNLPVTVPGFGITGAAAGNYTLTGTNGVTVNITKKDLTATYTGRDRVYDGQTWAGVVASSTDIVAGDAVSFYANEYAPYYSSSPYYYTPPAVFTGQGAKNVGTGKAITVNYDYLMGADAGNYNYLNRNFSGGYGTTTASVTPKPLSSLVYGGPTRVYDGSTAATVVLNKSSSGIVGADDVTLTQDAAFVDKNVGQLKTINVTNIAMAGADAGNYTLSVSSATASGNITAKPVTFTGISAVNRAYDGTTTVAVNAANVSSAGFVDGDNVSVQQPQGGLTTGTVANKNVGTGKVVTVSGLTLGGTDAGNYSIDASGSGFTVDITPKPLTASYTGGTRAYNGGVTAPVTAGSADIVSGDVVTFSQSAVFTGLNARDAGTHKPISITGIALGGADANNYALANTTASAFGDITARPVTVSYTAAGRVYNGLADTSISVTGATTDFVAGDLVGFTQTATLRGDGAAGDGRIVDVTGIALTGAQSANYALTASSATTTANIARRPIGVTGITATDRAYDGTTTVAINVGNASVNTGSIIAADVGHVAVELPNSGISTGTVATKDVGQNKTVSVTGLSVTGDAASNYTVSGVTGITVNITPRLLTAVYSAADKVYDGSALALVSAHSSDILAGDVGALGISATGSFAAGKAAGLDKLVNVSGGFLTGAERNNYALVNPTGTTTADIAQRVLTPSYTGGTRVYDGTAAAPVTASHAGVVSGDEVLFGQNAVFSGGKNVGNGKAIAISSIVLAGADAGNYRLSADTASATGSITAKPITVAGLGSVSATNRVYDGTNVVALTIPSGVTLTPNSADIVSGDHVDIGVPAAGVTTGTMADKNAGNNKPVAITGLTLSGADAANYVVAGAAGVTVNIARLDISALYTGVTRAYDGSTGVSVVGNAAVVLAGDDLTITGTGRYTGNGAKNAGTGKPLDVLTTQLSGADRLNYQLLNPTDTGTGTVTPRLLTPAYGSYTRVYDRTTDAAVQATGAGVIAGDTVNFSQTAVFTGPNGKDVGSGKTIAVSNIALGGADAANYALTGTTATASGSITPRPITLTGLSGLQAVDRTYDGTTTVTVNLQTSGTVAPAEGAILAGDNVSVNVPSGNVTTGSVANKNAGLDKPVVSIVGLGLTGTDATNYSIAGTTGLTVDITPRPITAVYSGGTRVYDGGIAAPVTATSADLIGGDTVGFGIDARFTGTGAKNVGSGKAVDILAVSLSGADAANYSLLNPTGATTASITPKTVSVLYTGGTRVYDGSTAAPVTAAIAGLVGGDSVISTATAEFTGAGAKNVGSGKAVSVSGIMLSGDDAGNYALSADTASTTASITPRPLRIDGLNGITATSRAYDGTNVVAVNVSASGTLALNSQDRIVGDDVGLTAPASGATTGTMADKNVGTGKAVTVAGLSLTGADAPNYSLSAATSVTVDITPRPLTAAYSGVARVYDGGVSASVVGTSSDILGSDVVSISGSGVFTGNGAKNVGTGKAINVTSATLAGADAANYALLNATGSATGSITPRQVSVFYTGGTRVYDGTTAAPVSSSSVGLVAGDAVSVSETAAFTGTGAKNVGSNKAVGISGITLSGDDAGNYVLTSNSAATTASITPRPLRVEGLTGVSATDRAYDGTNVVTISVQSSGTLAANTADLIAGDVVTVALPGGALSTGTMADKNVGSNKAVTVAGLTLGGADGGNYMVSALQGLTVNISPRLLTATWIGIDKTYDGTAAAQVAGSSASVIAGDLLTITGTGSFVAGKSAGTGKTISVTGGLLQGADSANYSLANASGTATAAILQKLLQPTYTGGTRVYDGTTAAPVTLGSVGLVQGDDVAVSQNAQFTGANAKGVGSGKAVSIDSITLSGSDAANYRLAGTTASTTASITPKGVNVAGLSNLSAVDRVYDGTRNVQIIATGSTGNSATSADFLAGDDVSIVVPGSGLGAGLMLDKNAGTNKAVAVSGLTLSGGDAANYQITGTAGVTVNIAPKPVSLVGVTAVDRVYDGSTAVAINTQGGSINGAIAGDNLSLLGSGVTGSMADRHVGNGKAVTVSGLALGGSDAGNYVASTPALSVSIAPRPFTATITVADKVYDGTDAASATLTTSGLVAGDQVTLAGGVNARFADKNVGSGKQVSATNLSLGGADAADYQLTSTTASATASITPAPLSIRFTGGLNGSSTLSKTYGDALSFAPGAFQADGLVAGETLALVTMGSAGAAASATVAGGPYAITLSDARGGTFNPSNYAMSYASGTLLVTPRPVTVTGLLVTRFADEAQPSFLDKLSMDGITVSAGGLVGDDRLAGAVIATPPGSATSQGMAYFDLVPAGAAFAAGSATNYAVTYANGRLYVLPTPARANDADTGNGGTVTGVGAEVDPAVLARALVALESNTTLLASRGTPEARLAQLRRAAEEAGDITVLLAGDGRRISLASLLKMPLISFDPVLRRLIFGPAVDDRR